MSSELIQLRALGPDGAYRLRNRRTITDVTGTPVAELSLVPRLFVTRTMSALHKAETTPLEDRVAAIARAGKAFATATVTGMSVEEYQRTVCRVSGTPISSVRTATEEIAHAAVTVHRSVQQARPVGAVDDWRDPLTRTAGQSGPAAVTYSPCTPPGAIPLCTRGGWNHWRWATASPCAPRVGSHSRLTG